MGKALLLIERAAGRLLSFSKDAMYRFSTVNATSKRRWLVETKDKQGLRLFTSVRRLGYELCGLFGALKRRRTCGVY